jgi:hypothetical protein
VVPWVERLPEGGISAIGGPERVVLRTPVPLRGEDLKTVCEFDIGAGETIPFVMSYGPSHLPRPRKPRTSRTMSEKPCRKPIKSTSSTAPAEVSNIVTRISEPFR